MLKNSCGIATFIHLHIYLESVNYVDLYRRVISKGLCHFSALVDWPIPIQVHVHLEKKEWINKFWFHSGPRFPARLNTIILGTEQVLFGQHWQSKERVLVLFSVWEFTFVTRLYDDFFLFIYFGFCFMFMIISRVEL